MRRRYCRRWPTDGKVSINSICSHIKTPQMDCICGLALHMYSFGLTWVPVVKPHLTAPDGKRVNTMRNRLNFNRRTRFIYSVWPNKTIRGNVEAYHYLQLFALGMIKTTVTAILDEKAAPSSQDLLSQPQDSIPYNFLCVEIDNKWAADSRGA